MYDEEEYSGYMTTGSPAYLVKEYKRRYNASANFASPFTEYVVEIGLPPYINKEKLEASVDLIGRKIYKTYWKQRSAKSAIYSPFKFYDYLNISKDELNALLLKDTGSLGKRFKAKIYQHNFSKEKRRYSVILITSGNELCSVYLLMHDNPMKKIQY